MSKEIDGHHKCLVQIGFSEIEQGLTNQFFNQLKLNVILLMFIDTHTLIHPYTHIHLESLLYAYGYMIEPQSLFCC